MDLAPGKTAKSGAVLKDLGNGLVMRRGRPEDADDLANFNAMVNSLTDQPDGGVKAWTLDLMSGGLPGFSPEDFTVVEDTGAIVSTLNLISQTWTYGGIEFGVGRIELVGTHPDYRRRGLVRAQMQVAHEWSAARGHTVQGITGIPWYYRQFGYEMALENMGGRVGYLDNVPRLGDGEEEPYRVRAATDPDIPFLKRVYDDGMRRYPVSCVRDEEMWAYELNGRREKADHRYQICVVESTDGRQVGLLAHAPQLAGPRLTASLYELAPNVSWPAVTPSVIRYLQRTGESYAELDKGRTFGAYAFALGSEHPAYHGSKEWLPGSQRPYAWYLRVADIPEFVRHVAPALEQRLAESDAAGHTGELKISFIDGGLRMSFQSGRLAQVNAWTATQADSRLAPRVRDALFPNLTFLQLLFGFRSVEDLEYAFPDCIISSDEARRLLNVLFPRRPSRAWGIE